MDQMEEIRVTFTKIKQQINNKPLTVNSHQIELEQAKISSILSNGILALGIEKELQGMLGQYQKMRGKSMQSNSSIRSSQVMISDSKMSNMKLLQNDLKNEKRQVSFKKVLESKQFQNNGQDRSLSKISRFSKSRTSKVNSEVRMKSVIEESKRRLEQLQSKLRQEEQLNDFEKNLLRQEKNRYLQKIEELQAEIEQLYRDNFRLKQVERSKEMEESLGERIQKYQPYVINTCNNDLRKINQRYQSKLKSPEIVDSLSRKLVEQKPFHTAPNSFKQKQNANENDFVLKQWLGDSFEKESRLTARKDGRMVRGQLSISSAGNNFDTFDMAETIYKINSSALGQSRQMVNIDSKTCTRNKVAFFKNSMVLVRDDDIEIAYKRSQLSNDMSKVRLIFFVLNRSQRGKNVSFQYDYQPEYFEMQVTEKLNFVQGGKQGREVIEIRLVGQDLNGVADVHVKIGQRVYDLWLPVNFLRFIVKDNYRMGQYQSEMTVNADRQFISFKSTATVLPVMLGGSDQSETWGYLWGQSKFGSGGVKLTWGRQLKIECFQKWIDFLGFVMHFFK